MQEKWNYFVYDLCGGIKIKHVATDLSAVFIASVMENCPEAVHVFDHFHVVKLMNEKLDDIRRKVYSMEKDYLKEQLRQIWMQPVKAMGECVFDDWVRQAEQSKKPPEKRTNAFGRYCEPIKNHNTWSRKRFYPNLQSLHLIPLPDGY